MPSPREAARNICPLQSEKQARPRWSKYICRLSQLISKKVDEVALVGVRNPSFSSTSLALHRIDFASRQRWLLYLWEARAVAGRTGMLSDFWRHGDLSGRPVGDLISRRIVPELARYPRAAVSSIAHHRSAPTSLRDCEFRAPARSGASAKCRITAATF